MYSGKKILNAITIRQILFTGLIVRLLAVFFSPGYAFHDDHFEMPELVFNWKDNISFLWAGSDVHIFSLLYPGLMYLLFEACHAAGIHRPEDMMFVVRLFHALVSLLSIYYSYLLTLRLTGKKDSANMVALAMALFWIFPFFSVRNLREFFCVPFLLIGSYHISDPKLRNRSLILAALFFALAFCIRFQTLFIPAGIGLYLLFRKQYIKKALWFAVAFVVAYMLTQGLFDLIYYGDPFANIKEYIRFNSNPDNIKGYTQGPWYQYTGTVAIVVWGPPFFLLCRGYIYCSRLTVQIKIFFVASLLFFIFHSYYSNKQERFILPFIPYFIMLGIIGWREYYSTHVLKPWLKKATKVILIWFFILNTVGLAVLTFTYSKRSRVEAMIWLRKRGDVKNLIIEGNVSLQKPPLFYIGKHLDVFTLSSGADVNQLRKEIDSSGKPAPNYIILAGNHNMDQRLSNLQTIFPDLMYETNIKTSFVDNIAHWLNPKHNQNESWYIYKIK